MFNLGFLRTKNTDKIVYIIKIHLLRVKEFFKNRLIYS